MLVNFKNLVGLRSSARHCIVRLITRNIRQCVPYGLNNCIKQHGILLLIGPVASRTYKNKNGVHIFVAFADRSNISTSDVHQKAAVPNIITVAEQINEISWKVVGTVDIVCVAHFFLLVRKLSKLHDDVLVHFMKKESGSIELPRNYICPMQKKDEDENYLKNIAWMVEENGDFLSVVKPTSSAVVSNI